MKQKPLILTEEQIDGKNPAQAAWLALLDQIRGLKGEEHTEYIRALPRQWRCIYSGFRLQNEVGNGGFHQFFWNGEGALNKETLEDLRLISAGPFILLFEEAMDEYQRHDYPGEKAESGNTWEAFTNAYKEKRMENLDDAFCQLPKTIAMHLSDYIRKNRDLYSQPAESPS